METEKLNEYLFADLVTRWATRIALSRGSSSDGTSVTTEDLAEALSQLELRRGVVQARHQTGRSPNASPVGGLRR